MYFRSAFVFREVGDRLRLTRLSWMLVRGGRLVLHLFGRVSMTDESALAPDILAGAQHYFSILSGSGGRPEIDDVGCLGGPGPAGKPIQLAGRFAAHRLDEFAGRPGPDPPNRQCPVGPQSPTKLKNGAEHRQACQ